MLKDCGSIPETFQNELVKVSKILIEALKNLDAGSRDFENCLCLLSNVNSFIRINQRENF